MFVLYFALFFATQAREKSMDISLSSAFAESVKFCDLCFKPLPRRFKIRIIFDARSVNFEGKIFRQENYL